MKKIYILTFFAVVLMLVLTATIQTDVYAWSQPSQNSIRLRHTFNEYPEPFDLQSYTSNEIENYLSSDFESFCYMIDLSFLPDINSDYYIILTTDSSYDTSNFLGVGLQSNTESYMTLQDYMVYYQNNRDYFIAPGGTAVNTQYNMVLGVSFKGGLTSSGYLELYILMDQTPPSEGNIGELIDSMFITWEYENKADFYSRQRTDGFTQQDIDNAYQQGYQDAYDLGFSVGYQDGESKGYGNGYQQGLSILQTDLDNMLALEYQRGYDNGYGQGATNAGDYSGFMGIIFSGLGIVGSLLEIELLPNITIGMIVAVPLVFGIIMFIVGRKKDD